MSIFHCLFVLVKVKGLAVSHIKRLQCKRQQSERHPGHCDPDVCGYRVSMVTLVLITQTDEAVVASIRTILDAVTVCHPSAVTTSGSVPSAVSSGRPVEQSIPVPVIPRQIEIYVIVCGTTSGDN